MRPDFPSDFRVQRTGVDGVPTVERPASEIADFLRANPRVAEALLHECYDKRYSPSTFITEGDGLFQVGWFSRGAGSQCVREFALLEDAATDYLLFSAGKGRWIPAAT